MSFSLFVIINLVSLPSQLFRQHCDTNPKSAAHSQAKSSNTRRHLRQHLFRRQTFASIKKVKGSETERNSNYEMRYRAALRRRAIKSNIAAPGKKNRRGGKKTLSGRAPGFTGKDVLWLANGLLFIS